MIGGRLRKALVTLGYVRDQEITSLLSHRFGVRCIDLDHFEFNRAVIKLIPAETARKYQILPLSLSGATLTIAMADPTNVVAMDDIKFMTGYKVEPVLVSETSLEDAIEKCYGSTRSPEPPKGASSGGFPMMGEPMRLEDVMGGPALTDDDLTSVGLSEIDLGNLTRSAEAESVIKLTNVLLVESLKRGASDIHIEPYEKEVRIRFRIDGILYNVGTLPPRLRDPLTARVKTMFRGDIAEKRLPQCGHFKIVMKILDRSRELSFRVSCLPTFWGERIVLRLCDRTKLILDLTKLGFEPESFERFQRAIARPHGMILVTGPTGSGKTTTLYSALASLNKPDTNIMTAEDPVEFDLPGINQVQVRSDLGLGAAACLSLFLRQDPNVILVGEIRDGETAKIALKAALTGHLVLASVTESDGASAFAELGIHPSMLGRALKLVLTQRLVRRICTECKTEASDENAVKNLVSLGVEPQPAGAIRAYRGQGCKVCFGTGYKGRTGLFEAMPITDALAELLANSAPTTTIRTQAVNEGMVTLQTSGVEKIKEGITTIEEVLRETVL